MRGSEDCGDYILYTQNWDSIKGTECLKSDNPRKFRDTVVNVKIE